ncbi:MAG: PrgI family protein [Patescibacteria group bacterium]|nr:PrgI family protein [Patescibacteria group bacterium]
MILDLCSLIIETMHANVPQFIDIEDKIAFGLTGKQLLWMAGMGAILLVIYNIFIREAFYFIGALVVVIFAALAFWKPQGVSMISFLGFAVKFLIRPRNYVWKRSFSGASGSAFGKFDLIGKGNVPAKTRPAKKKPTESQLKRIAWVLDTKK